MADGKFVGALILNPKDEILLQRKDLGYKRWPGFWTIFGGMAVFGQKRYWRERYFQPRRLKATVARAEMEGF